VAAEGQLPDDVIERLRADLVAKLQMLEQAPITCRIIPPRLIR